MKKVTAAIDKALDNLGKRLSVFDHQYYDIIDGTNNNNDNPTGSGSSNWDMINAVIAEHEGDSWYISKEGVYNAWTICNNRRMNIE